MSEKNMKITEDIIAQIQKDFGTQAEAIVAFLHGQPEFANESLRVLRCVLFLAEGKDDLLTKMIDAAKSDYRDVIFWAEYTNHDAENPDRIRNFNKSFGQHELRQHVDSTRLPSDVKRYLKRKK
jgi:hypothetical protein